MKLVRISAIWCTSCILTYNDFNEIKEEYKEFEYEELDYDTDQIEEYNVGNILPVIIVYKDNKEVTRIIGEKRKKEIKKVLEELGC
ncbi:MAG: thioredoxin family protein [Lactobacillales bacterium]|nr:thioredoxin family protein [Lactobacillales bacterium]